MLQWEHSSVLAASLLPHILSKNSHIPLGRGHSEFFGIHTFLNDCSMDRQLRNFNWARVLLSLCKILTDPSLFIFALLYFKIKCMHRLHPTFLHSNMSIVSVDLNKSLHINKIGMSIIFIFNQIFELLSYLCDAEGKFLLFFVSSRYNIRQLPSNNIFRVCRGEVYSPCLFVRRKVLAILNARSFSFI